MNNELKFIMLNAFASYMSKERVLINSFTTYTHGYKHTIPVTLGILIEKSDFNPNDVFIRIDDTVFNKECLNDITKFLEKINKEYKENIKKNKGKEEKK